MTCITGADGVDYCDGTYVGFCPSEKKQVEYAGTVRLTETSRIVADGVCSCLCPLEVAVFSPSPVAAA